MSSELLTNMVNIRSVYPEEGRLCEYMYDYLVNQGFTVERQQVEGNRYNLLVTKGQGERSILFYGHMDTVPLVNESSWNTNPFELTQVDGRLYGLGAYDMKSGISAFVDACSRSDRYTKMILTVDEENWSAGVWKALQERADFFSDVELAISAEPNFGLGLHGITRGRTGRYLYMVTFTGSPEHIARYRDATDAIEQAGNFIASLYARREELFHASGSVVQVRKIQAESIGMSVCGEASAEVEFLAAPGDSLEAVQAKIQVLAGSAVVAPRQRPTPYLRGYFFDKIPYAQELGHVVQDTTGNEMQLVTRQSVADDNALATLGVPVLTWGPDGDRAHAANEYVIARSVEHLALMYFAFLEATKNRSSTTIA